MLAHKKAVLVLLPNARARFGKALLKSPCAIFTKSFSSKSLTADDEKSFTVSYLMSSCGLSPETALRASQSVNFRSSDRPDSVLALLRNHGFTNSNISKLARTFPKVLVSNPEKTISPKLLFFQSIGIPAADLAKILSLNPRLLGASLDNQIIPAYNYLKSVILLDDLQVRKSLKYSSWIFRTNLEKHIIPAIAVLKEFRVSASNLSYLVTYYPSTLVTDINRLDKTVKQVVEMGLDPSKLTFVRVLQMMCRISKSTWEHKREVYRKCGWSEDDFQLAFKKEPLIMSRSEKKILGVTDLLVKKMGWKPTDIATTPHVLRYSLEKWTLPRCSVIQVLILKGLIKKDLCLSAVICKSDSHFLDKFVTKYEEHVPELLDVFRGKVGLAELGFKSGEICAL